MICLKIIAGNLLQVVFVLLFVTLCACSSGVSTQYKTPEDGLKTETDYRFFIKEYKTKFKHNTVLTFNRCAVKDLNGNEFIATIHFPITKELALKVFQNKQWVSDTLNEGTKVLYAIQTMRGHQGILIAGMDDDWVNRIWYYSYDLEGRFISKAVLYECGGDGGYSTESFGEFINDTVYSKKNITCEPKDEESGTINCDSTMQRIIIHSNGAIKQLSN